MEWDTKTEFKSNLNTANLHTFKFRPHPQSLNWSLWVGLKFKLRDNWPSQRSFVCTKGRDHRIQALGITGQGFGITAEGLGGITPKGFQDNCRGFRLSRITGHGFGIIAEGLGGN